jgi:hypothetical protein
VNKKKQKNRAALRAAWRSNPSYCCAAKLDCRASRATLRGFFGSFCSQKEQFLRCFCLRDLLQMSDRVALISYVDTVAPSVDLVIAPEHLEGVVQALAVLFEQGALLLNFPLDETIESAPRYSP